MTLVVVGTVLAAVLWPGPVSARRRLRDLRGGVPGSRPSADPDRRVRRALLLLAGAAGGAALVLVSVPWPAVAAAAFGVLLVLRRRRTAGARPPGELALALDLLGGCLSGGAALPAGLEAAAVAAGPDLAADLGRVAARLRAGDPPDVACASWLRDRDLAPLARTLARSSESGAAVAADVTRLAARVRAEERVAVQQRIARASVWVVLPVGLCFLPAFLLVGVVPIAVGLLQRLR